MFYNDSGARSTCLDNLRPITSACEQCRMRTGIGSITSVRFVNWAERTKAIRRREGIVMRKVGLAACLLICLTYPLQAHAKCGRAYFTKWIDVGSSAAESGIQINLIKAEFRESEPDVYAIAVKFRGAWLEKFWIMRQNQIAHFRRISGCRGDLAVLIFDRRDWAKQVEFGAAYTDD